MSKLISVLAVTMLVVLAGLTPPLMAQTRVDFKGFNPSPEQAQELKSAINIVYPYGMLGEYGLVWGERRIPPFFTKRLTYQPEQIVDMAPGTKYVYIDYSNSLSKNTIKMVEGAQLAGIVAIGAKLVADFSDGSGLSNREVYTFGGLGMAQVVVSWATIEHLKKKVGGDRYIVSMRRK